VFNLAIRRLLFNCRVNNVCSVMHKVIQQVRNCMWNKFTLNTRFMSALLWFRSWVYYISL